MLRTGLEGRLAKFLQTYPTPTADMKVPRNANVRIEPKFLKKFSWVLVKQTDLGQQTVDEHTCLSSYPEFRMIGGSRRLKKRVCLKV